jgi:hypothetical protein
MSNFQRSILLIIAAIGATGIVTGVAIAVSPNHFVKQDSGITACKMISENMAKKESSNDPLETEADYNRIIKPFEQSSHADIKVAGMNLVNTIYKADTKTKDLGSAMVLMNTIQNQWSALQVACGKQGVDVPQLPNGS